MSGVHARRRRKTNFEADHQLYILEDRLSELMREDFGFSRRKFEKRIEKYRYDHRNAPNLDQLLDEYIAKSESYYEQFIEKECQVCMDILHEIAEEFHTGNSIFVSTTPARYSEFKRRRIHLDEAIAKCWALKNELQFTIRNLPVNVNKYEHIAIEIDKEIDLIDGVRRKDAARFKKNTCNSRG